MPLKKNGTHTLPPSINLEGGYYQRGAPHTYERKLHVIDTWRRLRNEMAPVRPSIVLLSQEAKISWNFTKKCVNEFEELGFVQDPYPNAIQRLDDNQQHRKITQEMEVFLLSLHSENPTRPLWNYAVELNNAYNIEVCSKTIDNWFKKSFEIKVTLRKPNNVPLDKWRDENLLKYDAFCQKISTLVDHSKFHFLDEKHVVNKDCSPNRVRRNPLTGYIPFIPVSGDFRDVFNVFACITMNPTKTHPIAYQISKNNGTASVFVQFIESMIVSGWLSTNDVIIMDNATIHNGVEARIIEDLLWETVVDGQALNCIVVFLPARSPELNPIEQVFHILSRRIRSFMYQQEYNRVQADAVLHTVSTVLDDLSFETILNCCVNCGY